MALEITKLTISTFSGGGNKAPHSGSATFSDGKQYDWNIWNSQGGIIKLWSWRKRHGTGERFHFDSPARAKLIQAAIDEGRFEDKSVIKVSLTY